MKKHLFTILVLTGLLAAGPGLSMAAEQLPSTNPEAFWTYISKTNPYKDWQHWPGYPGKFPGKSPHGAYLEFYGNDIAIKAAKAGKEMPWGPSWSKPITPRTRQPWWPSPRCTR